MKVYSFIFARGGSKGIPKKNIKLFLGKPLIYYSINLAKKIKNIDKVFVSTDDHEIANISKEYGAEVIDRPSDLASDNSPEWLSWQHAIKWVENKYGRFETFLSLPTTSPLRNELDIMNCLSTLSKEIDIVIGITKSVRSPWFNMVKKDENQNIHLLLKNDKTIVNRQQAPDSFDITTCAYVSTANFIKANDSIFDGKILGVEIPQERAIDIDTIIDFDIAEFLMKRNDKYDA